MGQFQLKPSFAGGELTPALWGRTDIQKYDVGAACLKNAIVLRYGGVTRREGFRFVTTTKSNKKARLIPFSYNTEQNYVLEFTAGKVRFYTQGGIVVDGNNTPVEVSTPYTEAELSKIKWTQSADVLFLVHPNHPPATLTRYSITSWEYAAMDIRNGPFDDPNTTDITVTPSATTGTITLTADDDYFDSSMVGQLMRIGHTVPGQYEQGKPNTDTLQVSCVPGGTVYVESFGFWNGFFSVEKQDETGAWTQLKKQSGNRSQNYNMTFTNDDDTIKSYRVTSTEFDTTARTGEDANQRGYVTIQAFAKDYDGIVKIASVTSATSATANVQRKLGSTSATADFSIGAWGDAKGYPQAVGFFEDRLVFAGSSSLPQTYWASKSGDYYNFGTSIPQRDDDAITGTLASGQMNGVKAIVSFAEMIMLTSGGEYRVSGGGENFTPTNQQARAQEYRGISDVPPVVIGGRIVYVQQHGNIIRDLAYAYDVDKYTGDDVSLLAAHLFDGKTVVGMTYQQIPNSVVWCVREDGVLCGMTYVKEQDVYAWHKHETDGDFIDVCTIPGNNGDELWAVVKRGTTYQVEQMIPGSGVFMDSYYQNTSLNASTVTGLLWLAEQEVQVNADGHKLEGLTVASDGSLDLGRTYTSVAVGLPYMTQISTMPIEINGQDGTWAARKKRIQAMTIFFQETLGGTFGIVAGDLAEMPHDEIKWRTSESMGHGTEFFTGKKKVVLPQANYEDTLFLDILSADPFPMTILSIIPEVLPGG